VKHQRTGIS